MNPSKKLRARLETDLDRLDRRLRSYVPLAKAVMPFVLPSPDALDERYGIQSFSTNWEWRTFDRPDVSFSTVSILAMHLAGVVVVATPFAGDVDYIEIDLDAKDASAARTLHQRAQLVSDIFRRNGAPTGVMWGTSTNGGLRYRIPFDRPHDAAELRERTLALLHRAGVREQDGLVEVYPHGGRTARLPLGRGSSLCSESGHLLRLQNGGYAGLKIVERSTRRDVREMVRVWTERVESRRTTLATIFGAGQTISLPSQVSIPTAVAACTSQYEKKKLGTGASRDRTGWAERMADLYANGAPLGGRFKAAGDVLFDLCVAKALSGEEALAEYAKWLHGPHDSRDLTGPNRERVIQQMLREARTELARLKQKVAAGALTPGAKSPRSASTVPLLSTRKERNTFGRGWRNALLRRVPSDLYPALAAVTDHRLRDGLAVLAALVAQCRAENPAAVSVAIPVIVLKTIIGGGARKWKLQSGQQAAPYRVLLEKAQGMGIVGAVVGPPSVAARTATVYHLP